MSPVKLVLDIITLIKLLLHDFGSFPVCISHAQPNQTYRDWSRIHGHHGSIYNVNLHTIDIWVVFIGINITNPKYYKII